MLTLNKKHGNARGLLVITLFFGTQNILEFCDHFLEQQTD